MSQLTLQFPSMVRRNDRTELVAPLGDGRDLKISIQAASELLDRLTPTIVPFLPMSVLLAGQERRSLHIDANVDDTWWLNLMGGFWPLLKRYFELDEMTITRKGSGVLPQPLTNEIALMFSAGVDSSYSLKKMRDLGIHPAWFVNINAGAHEFDRNCWARRITNVKDVAQEVGVGLVTIDTNFHEVFHIAHIRSASVRNLAAAYSLFPAIARFVYSSTQAFEDISYELAKKHGIEYLEHAFCSTLTPPAISTTLLGWDADRITKTAAIGTDRLANRFLDVCVDGEYQARRPDTEPINCGRCSKCIRTMITLDHFKLLRNFKSQFPIQRCIDEREELLVALSGSTYPLDIAVTRLVGRPSTLPKDAAATVHDSMSWRITATLRGVSRTVRWFVCGSQAWLTLRPGSRPRRTARRLKMMLQRSRSS